MDKEYIYCQRLMDLRKELGKSIADMAYEAGLSASTISNYERGVRIPDGKALIKLAKYFGCTSDYLLGLSEYRNEVEKNKIDSKTSELVEHFSRLPSNDRLGILSALNITISYISDTDDEMEAAILYERLGNLILLYGEMIYKSWEFRLNDIEYCYDYLVFLKHYERLKTLINEHTEFLKTTTINSFTEEEDKLRLEQLIYNKKGDSNGKKD